MSINVPLDRIDDNPWQTRQSYDPSHIEGLAADIRKNGLLQPPVGRIVGAEHNGFYLKSAETFEIFLQENPEARFQLAFGHNRLRAYREIGEPIPVELRPLTDEQMADFAWSENAQRKDLNPVEEARAIQKRMADFGWSQKQVAEHLKLDGSTVANKLRVLKLPEELLDKVSDGTLSERVATALIPICEMPDEMLAAAKRWSSYDATKEQIIDRALKGWSSEMVRDAVKALKDRASRQLKIEREAAERKEKAAAAAAEQQAARERGEVVSDVLDLSSMGYGAYERVADDPKAMNYVAGCSPECKCRAVGRFGEGPEVPVCIDPERFRKLKAAQAREESKKRKALHAERLQALQAKIVGPDGRVVWTPQAIRVIVQQTCAQGNKKDFEAAVAAMGLPEVFAGLGVYGPERDAANKALETLDMNTALRLALEILVRVDLRNAAEYGHHKPERYELVMAGRPYPAPAVPPEGSGASGDGAVETIEPITTDDLLSRFRIGVKKATDWMGMVSIRTAARGVLEDSIRDLERLTEELEKAPGIPAKQKRLMQSEIDAKLEGFRKDLKRRASEAEEVTA